MYRFALSRSKPFQNNAAIKQTRQRGRISRTATLRGGRGTGVIMGSRPVVPAQYVPEELVSQAQVVLQGNLHFILIMQFYSCSS